MSLNSYRSFGLACVVMAGAIDNATAQPVLLNEIYVNPPGNTLPHEFIELKGAPLQALDGYRLLAVQGSPGLAGRVDLALNLDGVRLGDNGLLVVKVSAATGFAVPASTRVLEDARFIDTAVSPLNNNSVSVLLVQTTAALVEGTDYDANDDGVFDVAPLDTAAIADSIGIRQLATDAVYGGARIPNVGNDNRPEALVRLAGDTRTSNPEAWFAGRMNGSGLTVDFNAQVTSNYPPGATLTPGRDNAVFTAFRIVQSGSTTYVDEDGVVDSYTVALGAVPAAGEVTVRVAADSQVEVSVDGVGFAAEASLVFTAANALVPRTVTVRAVDDLQVEAGATHAGAVTHTVAASGDLETFPLSVPAVKVPVNIFDNESAFNVVQPTLEAAPGFAPADADDAAFWIHPVDSTRSLLLTTQKLGGAAVQDLNLAAVQAIQPESAGAIRLNNVDVLYGFQLGGASVDLAIFSDRIQDTLYIYRIHPDGGSNSLSLVSADLTTHIFPGSVPAGDTAYGLCLYRSQISGAHQAFVSRSSLGQVAQLELFDAGNGLVGWRRIRTIELPSVPQVEGMAADREYGWVYLAQEKVGIWKFPAEVTRASDGGTLMQRVKPTGSLLASDIEGLCIYDAGGGAGYLLVSNQGDNNFAAFSREGANDYLGSFAIGANRALGIDQVTTCDGADVCPIALPNFPNGVLIVQDGENDGSVSTRNTNFKLVPWERVSAAFNPALTVATGHNPRALPSRLPARIDGLERVPGGGVRLELSGALGGRCQLQFSPDLVEWVTAAELAFTEPKIRHEHDLAGGTLGFYRLIAP